MKNSGWWLVSVVLLAGCGRHVGSALASSPLPTPTKARSTALAGSKSCQDCHTEFYRLWSTSWHGLAMQPYAARFAQRELAAQPNDVVIGRHTYRAEVGEHQRWVRQTGQGGEKRYPIAYVMGGKNVYYFLTPMERGRLQVLPIAYDVHKKAWYDMAASGVRHFPDRRDEALDWTDRMFAFNTTCFNCHVTELSTNYDLATDTYHTTWTEPGISCESCHGSGKEHVRVMEKDEDVHKVKDLKIIRAQDLTAAQTNDLCATCHAKLVPLSLDFRPGERLFDHFDLITLEHADYYPDGRDLGENYTFTSWLMSPCVKSGKLDCNHCHTPSGRLRFEGENSNRMCMPCHEKEIKQPAAHGHHPSGSKGNDCVACHMPTTRFAAMGRTDHSMRPPTPAATIAFSSPNACTLCHADHDAAWANQWVGQWYKADYQAEILRRAELIDLARKRQWNRLPEMLAELGDCPDFRVSENGTVPFPDQKKHADEVYKTSLVRLLGGCDDARKWPALLARIDDPSPLVRSSAASALGGHLTPEVLKALLMAAADPSRLVRIRIAMSLAPLPPQSLTDEREKMGTGSERIGSNRGKLASGEVPVPIFSDRENLEKANREFIAAMQARPDDWASHANLGNFYMERRDFPAAAACFETAAKLEPRHIGPMVNASMAYSNMAQNDKAERSLRRALKLEPDNAAANFNLGLLLAEQGQLQEAEQSLRAAFKADPQMAAAAYNLGVMLAKKNIDDGIAWCQKAHDLRPADPKYAWTLALYQQQKGHSAQAIELLRKTIQDEPTYLDAYLLLAEIYQQRHDFPTAAKVYLDAAKIDRLPSDVRSELEAKSRAMQSERRGK